MTFETQLRMTKGGDAVRPSLSARRCGGCGASPGFDGVCEGCRRNRLTASHNAAAQPPSAASTSPARDATESASAFTPPGHDFGRVGVFAPFDQTPTQEGGLDEKFMQQDAPAAGQEQAAAPDLNTGEKTSADSNTPVVDKVELVTSSSGAVGGYKEGDFACDVSLNKPGPYNDIAFTGSVANVHQVQFHLSQGRAEDLRASRLAKRTATRGGKTFTKPGTDSPTASDGPPPHEYQFTKDKLVIADAPGWCKGKNSLDTSDFPITYSADFSTYAYDPLNNKIVASISYHVEISKTHYSQGAPTNTASVTEVKIGGAVPSPLKPKK